MSSFLGIDVHASPTLITELQRWGSRTDAVIELVSEAERLAELPVGVTLQLDGLGADGRTMAAATRAAHDQLVRHRLTLPALVPAPAGRSSPDGSGEGAGADDQVVWRRLAGEGSGADDQVVWRRLAGEGSGADALLSAEQRRVDRLVAAIRHDTAEGRDPVARFRDLNRLLDRATGEPAGPARAWATSLVFAGLGGRQLAGLFSSGCADLVVRIGGAMRAGLAPDDAELPSQLFPAGYVEWHRLDAQRAELQQQWNGRTLAWRSIMADHAPAGMAATELEHLRNHPTVDDLGRAGLDRLSRGERWSALDLRQRLHLASVVRADLAEVGAQVSRLEARLAKVRVETLGRSTPLGDRGTLGSFDALAATASMALRPPAAVVGGAMARWVMAEGDRAELHDVARAARHVATADAGAAAAFFSTLGPERSGRLLHELQLDGDRLRPGGGGLAGGGLAHDLSVALGRASSSLAPGFAIALIETQPEPIGGIVGSIPPEVLFAHGEFDGDFLVAAAATSVAVHDGRVVWPSGDWREPRVDPVDLMLDRVVEADRGADLVRALDAESTTRSLIWGGVVMAGSVVSGVAKQAGNLRADRPSARTRLLAQAGNDAEAAAIIVDLAGARRDTLDPDTARGLSQLLATQIPNHLHSGIESPYFVAVQNVFAAGEGVELDVAVRAAVIERLVAGFETSAPGWFDRAGDVGGFAGRIDGLKFVVFEHGAAARDAAIERSAAMLSGLTSGLGIATGLAGIAFTGGAALPLALTGVGASGAGWIAPTFLDDADHRLELYRSGMVDALRVGRRGEAVTIWAAAASGSVTVPDGTVTAVAAAAGPAIVVLAGGQQTIIPVDPDDPAWVDRAHEIFDEVDATVDLDPEFRSVSIDHAIHLVTGAVFVDGYAVGFEAGAGLDTGD